MLTIKNIQTPEGKVVNVTIPSQEEHTLDGEGRLLILPSLVDPDIQFSDWRVGASAALAGGVTTFLEAPHRCVSAETLSQHIQRIDAELKEAQIPLKHQIFIEAEPDYIEEIPIFLKKIAGIKITDLLMAHSKAWNRVFQLAAQENLLILMQVTVSERKTTLKALLQALELVEKYGAQLIVLDVKTKEEMKVISEAKKKEMLVFAEVRPQTLMLSNPQSRDDQNALWKAIKEGGIDLIGSGSCPEICLPLLLSAYKEKKLSLEEIINLTRKNSEMIFRLERSEDWVIVDLDKKQKISQLAAKACASFIGMELQGWPIMTILNGKMFCI